MAVAIRDLHIGLFLLNNEIFGWPSGMQGISQACELRGRWVEGAMKPYSCVSIESMGR